MWQKNLSIHPPRRRARGNTKARTKGYAGVRVVVGYELSGITRKAFTDAGHIAMSCDLEPTMIPGWHYQGDIKEVFKLIRDRELVFDLAIFHPDCTYFTLAGARWFTDPDPKWADRKQKREEAIRNFKQIQALPITRICIENPQPLKYVTDRVGEFTQKIQPWMFGTPESKGLCLWLKGLPPLKPTDIVPKDLRKQSCWRMAPGPNRKKLRSMSFPDIAAAMVKQWGCL
jgi:hypothetical protein